MKWYEMSIETSEGWPPPTFYADEKELSGCSRGDFKDGNAIADWNNNSLLCSSSPDTDGDPDDVLDNVMNVLVFSGRFINALRDAHVATGDIQYLPIHVFRSTGEELPGFAVANVIARVAALDPDRSFMLELDYDKTDALTGKPRVKGIGKTALRSEPLQRHDVIRLLEFFPSVFVSQRFVDVFNKHRFTGAEFKPVVVF
jgi:hypothetical protein